MGGCGHEWRSVSVSVCLCDKLYQNTDGLRLCASVFWKGGGGVVKVSFSTVKHSIKPVFPSPQHMQVKRLRTFGSY